MVKNRHEIYSLESLRLSRNPDLTVFPQIGPEKVRGSDVPCDMDRELHRYRFLFSFPIPVSVSSTSESIYRGSVLSCYILLDFSLGQVADRLRKVEMKLHLDDFQACQIILSIC